MSILTDYSQVPTSGVHDIIDWKDIENNPDIEVYLLEEYNKNLFENTFDGMLDTLLTNKGWGGTKLYYMIQGMMNFLSNNLLLELNRIYEFFDLNFLKRITLDDIENASTEEEKDELNNYYVRFFELFNDYASFLKPYLNIFEDNSNVLNNLKKDLLIYHHKTIYNMRGNETGYKYLENIISPITAVNQQTGVTTQFNINIDVEEWGEYEEDDSISEDKQQYMYKLVLTNISNKDIKVGVLNILNNILHPAGYRLIIKDVNTFLIPLSFTTKMISTQTQFQDTTFFVSTNDFEISGSSLVTPVDGSLFNYENGMTNYTQTNKISVKNSSFTTLLTYDG